MAPSHHFLTTAPSHPKTLVQNDDQLHRCLNLSALTGSAIDSSFKNLLRDDDLHPEDVCNSQTSTVLPYPSFLFPLRDIPDTPPEKSWARFRRDAALEPQ